MNNKEYNFHNDNPNTPFECKNCRTCDICNRTIAKNHKHLDCNQCGKKVHGKCNKLNDKDLKFYRENPDSFTCTTCLKNALPMHNLNDKQFDLE